MAKKLSGLSGNIKKCLIVGAGALGSQATVNMARLGIGKFDVIDKDRLFPHNLSRHALLAEHVGWNKAVVLSEQLNLLMDDNTFSKPITCDIIKYQQSVEEYDLIVDFSTSTAALRSIAKRSVKPSIVSSYMTQSGRYLICLFEGKDKSIRIDDLEYQLAYACVNNKELGSVLKLQDEKEIRYSGACSDVTTVLPQDRVAIHSGIITSYIKQNMEQAKPMISVWELQDNTEVKKYTILPSEVKSENVKDWDVRISQEVIRKMMSWREEKLKVETGGILIGGFDTYNKIVYIVDVIHSPKDSVEKPYSYIRGFDGLRERVEYINTVSGGRLNYIGEWHSHLKGVCPSQIDEIALKEQSFEMGKAGLPGIMMIVGDKGKYNILLEQD